MMFTTPDLYEIEIEVLDDIDTLEHQLRHRLHEPRRWSGSLRKLTLARAIQGSNSIEGFNAALDDVVAIVVGEDPLDATEETKQALKGYQDAMTYVLQMLQEPAIDYSGQLLKSLHFMMTSYDLTNRPGLWRHGDIFVEREETGETVYKGPHIDDVPALIDELADSLNHQDDNHRVVRAGMAHLNLVMVHPFRDGNGRMARCLQSLVLAREGSWLSPVFLSIEEYLGRNTQDYYDELTGVGGGSWQPERDARSWIRFVLTAHLHQAKTLVRRVHESEQLWGALESLTDANRLNPRSVVALFDAALGHRVRSSTYRASLKFSDEEVSEVTASRDLRLLVEAGLLTAVGERRGRHYLAAEPVRAARAQVVEGRDSALFLDPFAD